MAYPTSIPHRPLRGCMLAGLLAACFLLALPCAALALTPVNDDFAAAELLAGEHASATGDNSTATQEAGEPSHGYYTERSVWYAWTAPSDGAAVVDTAGSDFDT